MAAVQILILTIYLLLFGYYIYQQNYMEREQSLEKLKTLWEYFLPEAQKNLRKKLKSRTMEEYSKSVQRLLNEADSVSCSSEP